jgi:hypothetical protein
MIKIFKKLGINKIDATRIAEIVFLALSFGCIRLSVFQVIYILN